MYKITVQRRQRKVSTPDTTLLKQWAKSTLQDQINDAELTIRIVNMKEMTALNTTYRRKAGPTNVLSFPFDMPKELQDEIPLLGDLVICADVVNQEAIEQGKTFNEYWAHMVVHGTLHLLGYDHVKESDAILMEAQEAEILHQLGFKL